MRRHQHRVAAVAAHDRLAEEGLAVKALNVGSSGGAAAARRGECDLAGVHLLEPATGLYNHHLLAAGGLELVTGYLLEPLAAFAHPGEPFTVTTVQASGAVRGMLDAGACRIVPASLSQWLAYPMSGVWLPTRSRSNAYDRGSAAPA